MEDAASPGRNGGASGGVGVGESVAMLTVNWNAVNDPPVNTLPPAQTIRQDQTLTFSGSKALAVSDVDAGNQPVQITLSVAPHGSLTLGHLDTVTFIAGDGTADPSMTFQGALADVNHALDTRFAPDPAHAGAHTLTLASNDLGHTGGTAQIDTDNLPITVTAVNHPPTLANDTARVRVDSTDNWLDVSANDSNLPDDPQELVALVAVGTPQHGSARIVSSNGSTGIAYTPEAGYAGTDTFGYTGSDFLGATATAIVTVTVDPGLVHADGFDHPSVAPQTKALEHP